MHANILAAWFLVSAGIVSGAIIGLNFAQADWLGGYHSWRRRLLRLGHIACFGMAALNGAYAATMHGLTIGSAGIIGSWALISAGITMPLCCALSAWRQPLRHLFPIPVVSSTIGCTCALITLITSHGGL
ncbi:MAG: hypothetical protein ACYTF0_06980 [Planctomycetota bacterium]|jgi:hypothetical protein